MTEAVLSTTVVGSYPQPEWLIDRAALAANVVPRVRIPNLWRIAPDLLEEAQDDATRLAISDMERAGIDVVTDGEIRRESYSNRFATALEGIGEPASSIDQRGVERFVPRVVGRIARVIPVEVRDMTFLREHTDRPAKITLPGPITMALQSKNEFYADTDELVMDYAAAINAEALDLVAAGADVIQIDDPWIRFDPERAQRIAVAALDRAIEGVTVTTAVHLCFGYAAVVLDEKPSGYSFLAQLAGSTVDQISIEAAQPKIDLGILGDFADKTVMLGVIDLSDPVAEHPEVVAERIRAALRYLPADRLVPAPDCGMKYLAREVAFDKLCALVEGARIVRAELSS